jgi:Flavodoxin domain
MAGATFPGHPALAGGCGRPGGLAGDRRERFIAEVLSEHGLEATVLPPEQVEEVDGYDAVVLGSAVYAGHWLKPARELVERHADGLAGRCGGSPAARSGTHRSRKRIRWMWPSSRV